MKAILIYTNWDMTESLVINEDQVATVAPMIGHENKACVITMSNGEKLDCFNYTFKSWLSDYMKRTDL